MGWSDEVLADSPVAYYRMGESSGQPQDSSGNGNHTTVTNGTPVYSKPSLILSDLGNTAIELAAASVEYFTAPDHATLDLGDVLTLECWIKRGVQTGAFEPLICKGVNAYVLYFNSSDDRIIFDKRGVQGIVASTVQVSDENIHHIVYTKNGATSKIYLDAVDVTGTVTDATLADNTTDLFIGAREDAGVMYNGVIDEVAIYPTALSAARVAAHYNVGRPPDALSLLPGNPSTKFGPF